MATPAMRATTAVRGLKIAEIEQVYPNNLPTDLTTITGRTVSRVTEINTEFTNPGNNDWSGVTEAVQVQIFYATGFQGDPEAVENKLVRGLKERGYRCWPVTTAHTVDPDTRQLTATYKFNLSKGRF